MNFTVSLSHETAKILLRLPYPLRERFLRKFDELAADPLNTRTSAPLQGKGGVRKSQVGGWRILFTVDGAARIVYIATIGRRGQIYRNLRNLTGRP